MEFWSGRLKNFATGDTVVSMFPFLYWDLVEARAISLVLWDSGCEGAP